MFRIFTGHSVACSLTLVKQRLSDYQIQLKLPSTVSEQDLWLANRPTVILVTHDLREAAFLADRILVMSAHPGRIILDRKVTTPRPRSLESLYTPETMELLHELREHIHAARSQAALA